MRCLALALKGSTCHRCWRERAGEMRRDKQLEGQCVRRMEEHTEALEPRKPSSFTKRDVAVSYTGFGV